MARKKVSKKFADKKVKSTVKPLSIKKPFTKSELVNALTEMACITRKQAVVAIDSLKEIINAHLCKKGPGLFTLVGVAKFRVIKKPATKAKKGINPFTGEPMTFKAKPARNVIKVRLLKQLKDAVR